MWDLSLDTKRDWIFYDHPSYSKVHWIEPMFNTEVFFANLVEQWENIKGRMNQVYDYIDRLGVLTKDADVANNKRWPQYESANSIERAERSKKVIQDNIEWIDSEISYMAGTGVAVRPDDMSAISFEDGKFRVGFVRGGLKLDVFRVDGSLVRTFVCNGGETFDAGIFGKGVFFVRASGETVWPVTLKVVN